MKNSMQVMCATLTSMEVAEMVEKSHQDLMKSIRRYSRYIEEANYSLDAVIFDGISEQNNLGEGNFALTSGKTESNQLNLNSLEAEQIDLCEFWTESSYIDQWNREKPCYNITKKGCEFIAHKCTGKKGTVFTARYINRFHEMEQEISGNKPRKRLSAKKPVPKVSNCPAPPAENWYRKNRWKIKSCVPGLFQSENHFLSDLFDIVNSEYDTVKAAKMYEEQTGKKAERAVDLLDFFPDMGEFAQNVLDYVFKWRKVNGLDPDDVVKKKDE